MLDNFMKSMGSLSWQGIAFKSRALNKIFSGWLQEFVCSFVRTNYHDRMYSCTYVWLWQRYFAFLIEPESRSLVTLCATGIWQSTDKELNTSADAKKNHLSLSFSKKKVVGLLLKKSHTFRLENSSLPVVLERQFTSFIELFYFKFRTRKIKPHQGIMTEKLASILKSQKPSLRNSLSESGDELVTSKLKSATAQITAPQWLFCISGWHDCGRAKLGLGWNVEFQRW